MRTIDPSVLVQQILGVNTGVRNVGNSGFTGLYYATVLDTDGSNVSNPTGTMRVVITGMTGGQPWGPIPYPGEDTPPDGTQAVVGFNETTGQCIAIAFIGWSSGGSVSGVSSFNTRTGAVVPEAGDYDVADVTGAAPAASPTFTGTPLAPTAVGGTNTTQLATTAFVTAAIAAAVSGSGVTSFDGRSGAVVPTSGDYAVSDVTGAAPIASPTFTGTPTSVDFSGSPADNTLKVATDKFVQSAIANAFASPAFTGEPTAPTPTLLDNSTDIATTAFVQETALNLSPVEYWQPLVASANPSGFAMPTTAPNGFAVELSDDFTGGSLSTSKWFKWGSAYNSLPGSGDYAWWDSGQLGVSGSLLTITTVGAAIPFSITAASWSSAAGGTFTYTCNCPVNPGDKVSITGITPSGYNLTNATVAVANYTSNYTSSFTVTGVGANPGAASLSSAQMTTPYYKAGGIGSGDGTSGTTNYGVGYGGVDMMMRRVGTSGFQTACSLFFPYSGNGGLWPDDGEIDGYEDSGNTIGGVVKNTSSTYHYGSRLTFTSTSGGAYTRRAPTVGAAIYGASGGVSTSGTPIVNSITPLTPTTGTFTTSGGTITLSGTNQATCNSSIQETESGIDATEWHVWSIRWMPGLLVYLCDGVIYGTTSDPAIQYTKKLNWGFQVEHEGSSGAPSFAQVGTTFDQTELDWIVVYTYQGPPAAYAPTNPMPTGQFYPRVSGVTTGSPLTANYGYATPLVISQSEVVVSIGSNLSVAGAGGAPVMRYGIYEDNGAGLPGALVLDCGTAAATGTGVVSITGLTQQLDTSGTYWLACSPQGATVTQPTTYISNSTLTPLGNSSIAASTPSTCVQNTTTASFPTGSSLPAKWPTSGNSVINGPLVQAGF